MPAFTFRPIDVWPGERTRHPQRSRFDASTSATNELLDRELDKLGAKHIVIQLALSESDIRLDGKPRAHARPAHPGVVLAFESKYGPLKYATDTFDQWQDNVRAIALGLEALRKVDRYGITKRGEQYTGWKALGTGSSSPAGPMTLEEAAALIAETSCAAGHAVTPQTVIQWSDEFVIAYRRAASRLHPDRGGSTAEFQRLQDAKRLLEAHHAAK